MDGALEEADARVLGDLAALPADDLVDGIDAAQGAGGGVGNLTVLETNAADLLVGEELDDGSGAGEALELEDVGGGDVLEGCAEVAAFAFAVRALAERCAELVDERLDEERLFEEVKR